MQSFKMAIKSIAGNKLRSFLTMLGIIIGVMALVILVSLVRGATSSVTDRIASLGNNMISVTISDSKGRPLTPETLDQWRKATPGIGEIAPYSDESMTVKYGSTAITVPVHGTVPAYGAINGLKIKLGRFLKTPDLTSSSNVCVLNEATAIKLIGYADCLGCTVSMNGMKYQIVGVLEDDTNSIASMFNMASYVAYIPRTALIRQSSTATMAVSSFQVNAADGFETADTKAAITALLLDRFDADEDAFRVSSSDALENTTASITSILTMLLGGIAAISLLVGGIGIMNIMLVTVTERTREIGIRKAIGATRGAILRQFLLEAVMLSMLGCLTGIFLSWVMLRVITVIVSSLSLTFSMDLSVVLLSVSFCLAIGVIFGIYPANQASKMKPIDALHYGG